MKKALVPILVVLVLSVAALAAVIAYQPEDFTISRSAEIAASPETVFQQINDFHKWQAWSPWAKIDPEMKTTYSGPQAGTGASYAWAGNSDVGEGTMTIIDSRPNEAVKIELQFLQPFAARHLTEFRLTPYDGGTNVTWTISGKNGFIAKAFCLVVDMDKMLGSDFEKGLAQLKNAVESK
jgi:uncharacterized protein YndB with AHSA1/START domain